MYHNQKIFSVRWKKNVIHRPVPYIWHQP